MKISTLRIMHCSRYLHPKIDIGDMGLIWSLVQAYSFGYFCIQFMSKFIPSCEEGRPNSIFRAAFKVDENNFSFVLNYFIVAVFYIIVSLLIIIKMSVIEQSRIF